MVRILGQSSTASTHGWERHSTTVYIQNINYVSFASSTYGKWFYSTLNNIYISVLIGILLHILPLEILHRLMHNIYNSSSNNNKAMEKKC
jgi:hypothetical protein